MKSGRYRAQLVRRVYIAKGKGKERPLGIPALEDKLVQLACAKLLGAIDEEDFLDGSHGYRPGRGARDTLIELTCRLTYGSYGYVVEADIRGFFDTMDHDWLLKRPSDRIDDRAFLKPIGKWLKAGVLETDGTVLHPDTGTPQGGIVSPVLANLYLHHVLDLWFEHVVKPHGRGEALWCRYADDFVGAFRDGAEAQRFFTALPKRLGKYGLAVAPEKTQILRFCRFHPSKQRRIAFLGFELFWFKDRQGVARVHRRTARKKLPGAVQPIKEWVKRHRHLPGRDFIKGLNRRLIGHYHYYGLRGNARDLWVFYREAIVSAFKWFNRRGGKHRSFTWGQFNAALTKLRVAKPRITEGPLARRVFA